MLQNIHLKNSIRLIFSVASISLLVGCGGSSGGGSIDSEMNQQTQDNQQVEETVRTYQGELVDIDEAPISGALVSLGGIEAEAPTDSQGRFTIRGIDEDQCQTMTALVEGYEPLAVEVDTTAAAIQSCEVNNASDDASMASSMSRTRSNFAANNLVGGSRIRLDRLDVPAVLHVNTPLNNLSLIADSACNAPTLTVSGAVSLNETETFLHVHDVVILIDTSASTADMTGADLDSDGNIDTILQASLSTAARLAERIAEGGGRVSIAKFARAINTDGSRNTDQTRILNGLTQFTNVDDLTTYLDTIELEGSQGGTDTEFAIRLAVDELLAAENPSLDVSDDTSDEATEIEPIKSVVLISDGIPTLPVGSGLTQEPGDRAATLSAARYAAENGVRVFPIVIQSEDDANRPLTTLPSVQALTGAPGQFNRVALDAVNTLFDIVDNLPLSGIREVSIANTTTSDEMTVLVGPSGEFSGDIPAVLGENTVELSVNSGLDSQMLVQSISFNVRDEVATSFDTWADPTAISEIGNLGNVIGVNVRGNRLKNILMTYAHNARPIPGYRTLTATGETISIRTLFKYAGYRSDHGYFVYDPLDPPTSAAEVIAELTQDNLFFYSNVANGDLSGSDEINISVAPGSEIGFFVVPNGRLSDVQAGANIDILFSVPTLNPGSFTQFLGFYDAADDSELVAGENDRVIISIEDISLRKSTDRSFEDVGFEVRGVAPSHEFLNCDIF